MHDKLLKVVRTLETDYEPYGKVAASGSDCSCGCRHFVKLASDVGEEWGVCANPESARAGFSFTTGCNDIDQAASIRVGMKCNN
jgi:hypothetical protein